MFVNCRGKLAVAVWHGIGQKASFRFTKYCRHCVPSRESPLEVESVFSQSHHDTMVPDIACSEDRPARSLELVVKKLIVLSQLECRNCLVFFLLRLNLNSTCFDSWKVRVDKSETCLSYEALTFCLPLLFFFEFWSGSGFRRLMSLFVRLDVRFLRFHPAVRGAKIATIFLHRAS